MMQKTKLYKRCLSLLASLMMAMPAFSLAEDFLVVKGGLLNLRKEASLESSVLAQYPTGTWMTVLESGDEWTKVSVNGKEGYVMTKYLASANADGKLYIRTNTGANLNLRSQPSLEGDILGSYKPGTAVTVQARGNGWYKVSLDDQTGYMASRYLSGATSGSVVAGYPKNGVVANPGANQVLLLRETASTDARVIGYYGNGVSVKLLGESGSFYKVTVDGKNGYMMKKYIKVSSSSAGSITTPAKDFPQAPFTAKLANPNGNAIVNFRKSASLSGSIIKAYPVGTEIEISEVGEYWCKGTIDGVEGYVSVYFLHVSK